MADWQGRTGNPPQVRRGGSRTDRAEDEAAPPKAESRPVDGMTPTDRRQVAPPRSYFLSTQNPLQSLIFLSPLIVFYELGLLVFGTDQFGHVFKDIYARRLLIDFFEWFGISAYHIGPLIVVAALLGLHVVRRDPWRFDLRLYGYMGAESLALSLPLFVFSMVFFRVRAAQSILAATDAPGAAAAWQSELVFHVGAGIYEELLFRLIGLAILHAVFCDLFRLGDRWGIPLSIALSAIAFALYHFTEKNPFQWSMFLFYALAGVYFAGVYLSRGFGVVAGTHAM